MPQNNFLDEMKAIKSVMKESGQKLVFKSAVATRDKFKEMINKEPKVLHISCHGLKIPIKRIAFSFNPDAVEQENCLLFEKENGEGELVNSQQLNRIISQAMPTLDVVFLAACDSEFVGKIFLKCGARHVICVKKKREVLDDAAIDFTTTFYGKMLNGMNVCEAFSAAKRDVEFKH